MRTYLACVLLFAVPASAQELRRAGFMGVQVAAVPEATRKELNLPSGGVLVQGLAEGGTAKAAGIIANDIILQVNGKPVADVAEFVRMARELHSGETATLQLRRGASVLTKELTVKPRPYESAYDVITQYRAVTVDGSLRRVIITAPREDGRHPAILYITGIGCFSQESLDLNTPDAKLLYGLTRAGFVTMRVEKTGMGDSQGPPCDSPAADLNLEMRGYVAGLRALKEYDFVDPARIFIAGISIGGVQAPLVAAQEPVQAAVVINTVSKNFLEYLLDTRRRQMLLRKTPYDEIESRMKLVEGCNHALVIEKKTPQQVIKEAPECEAQTQYPAPYTYMQQWAALNIAAEWKKTSMPVLIVHGLSDYIATTADSPYLEQMLNSFHAGRATRVPVEGMDHYMTRAANMETSMNRPASVSGEFATEVLSTITEWLRRRDR